jgi:hypothetical protein
VKLDALVGVVPLVVATEAAVTAYPHKGVNTNES